MRRLPSEQVPRDLRGGGAIESPKAGKEAYVVPGLLGPTETAGMSSLAAIISDQGDSDGPLNERRRSTEIREHGALSRIRLFKLAREDASRLHRMITELDAVTGSVVQTFGESAVTWRTSL